MRCGFSILLFLSVIALSLKTLRAEGRQSPLDPDMLDQAREKALHAPIVPAVPVSTPYGWLDAEYAARHVTRLDWTQLPKVPQRVIYIGEQHYDSGVKLALIANMQKLHAGGVTHLGIEIWGDDYQPLLTQYSKGEVNDEVLRKELRRLRDLSGALFVTDYLLDEYIKVVHSARDAGIQLLALDIPYQDEENIQRLCEQDSPPPQCRYYDPNEEDIVNRDFRMASNISGVLRTDSQSKIVALVGLKHASREHQPSILRQYGWDSKAYIFANGQDLCSSVVRQLGYSNESVFIDIPDEDHGSILSGYGPPPLHFDGCLAVRVGPAVHHGH